MSTITSIMSFFGYSFWPKKTGGVGKGPFDDNVFKNPARYIYSLNHYVITSGAKNVTGKMQRVLLTN